MSKITNDGLIRCGTWCFTAVPVWQQWASKGSRMHADRTSFVLTGPRINLVCHSQCHVASASIEWTPVL